MGLTYFKKTYTKNNKGIETPIEVWQKKRGK
jgi:hypothetical protein